MADLKLNALSANPGGWTSACSLAGSDSGHPSGSYAFTFAQLGAVYGAGPANPSASVGLTAINGSAATFLRSDGAPAISQAITPTWTGLHTFTGGINAVMASAGITLAIGRNDGGANTLAFDTNGRALMKTGGSAQMAWVGDQNAIRMASNTLFGFSSNTNAINADNDTSLLRDAAGIFGIYDNQAGGSAHGAALHYGRRASDTDPAAPTDGATLYSKQVGGKNALFVRFPTGAAIQLAIEL